MKSAVCFIFVLLNSLLVYCQKLSVQHYSIKDGLSHPTAYRLMQDSLGFIWISTDYGFNRFDGKYFKKYSSANGLSNNSVISVTEGSRGIKLVSTYGGGVYLFKDTSLLPVGKLLGVDEPKIVGFATFSKHSIWLIDYDGFRLCRIRNKNIQFFKLKNSEGDTVKANRIFKNADELLVTTDKGVYKIDDDDSIRLLISASVCQGSVVAIARDRSGKYWLGTDSSIVCVTGGKRILTIPTGLSFDISAMVCDSNDNIWISTLSHGIHIVDGRDLKDMTDQCGLGHTIVNDLLVDNANNIWIATYGYGLFQITGNGMLKYSKADGISIQCKVIEQLGDKFIIGSLGQISVFDNGKLLKLHTTIKATEYIYFCKLIRDKIFIGTPRRLIVIDTKNDFKEKSVPFYDGLPHGAISISCSSVGEVIVGTYRGLFKLQNDFLTPYLSYLPTARYNTILFDRNDNLLLAANSNLISIKRSSSCSSSLLSVSDGIIYKILEDKYGRIWVATSKGLFVGRSDEFSRLIIKKDLPDICCKALFEDKDKMWIGTLQGVSCVDLNTLAVSGYIFTPGAHDVLSVNKSGNNLLLGTVEGLLVKNLAEVNYAHSWAPLYVTSVTTPSAEYIMPHNIVLPYNENKLSVSFIALNYANPNQVEYRYRLSDQGKDWLVTHDNSINIPMLEYGQHMLQVQARIGSGLWQSGISLNVQVEKPFWAEWWFYAIVCLIGAVIVYLSVKYILLKQHVKRVREQSTINKIIYLKQQALNAFINPHFIFNCLNSIQLFFSRNKIEEANDYLASFARFIRMMMENSQEAFITLGEELTRLELYLKLEKLRVGEKLQYEFVIDPKMDIHHTRIPNMVIQPYVENAIWHGIMPKPVKGRVIINVENFDAHNIVVSIADDGIGIEKSLSRKSKRKSVSTQLISKRLDILESLLGDTYTVQVSDNKPGVLVQIILPRNPSYDKIELMKQDLEL